VIAFGFALFLVIGVVLYKVLVIGDSGAKARIETALSVRMEQLKRDFKFRRKALQRRAQAGLLDTGELSAQLRELDQDIAVSIEAGSAIPLTDERQWRAFILLMLVAAGLAVFSYVYTGNYAWLQKSEYLTQLLQQDHDAITVLEAKASKQQSQRALADLLLASRLKVQRHKLDPNAWLEYGDINSRISRFEMAVQGYRRALALSPENVQIQLQLAKALASKKDPAASKESRALVNHILKTHPKNAKTRLFSGFSAFQAGNYQRAVADWSVVLKLLKPKSKVAELVRRSIKAAQGHIQQPSSAAVTQDLSSRSDRPAVQSSSASIAIQIDIPESVRASLKGSDTLFVFAKAVGGPPIPLAVKRFIVSKLPKTVILTDADAMTPKLRLSKFDKIVVSARISTRGIATDRTGPEVRSGVLEYRTLKGPLRLKFPKSGKGKF